MDFKELYEKAQKNAKKEEKKVTEAKREMESRKRKQDELMAIERSREKFDLKRRILQHKEQIKNSTEQKKDFFIPKKDFRSPENNVNNLKKQNLVDGKKISNSKIEVNKSTSENVNKLNSKQLNYSKVPVKNSKATPPAQNFNSLLKQAERNDSSAVEQLFNELESSSKSNKKAIPLKPKKLLPKDELGITAGLNLSQSAAREKQKEFKQKSKIETKMTEHLNSQKSAKTNKTINNTKMPSNNQKLINSQFPTTKNYSQPNSNSIQKNLSSLPTNVHIKELPKTNGLPINKTITKSKNKVRISLPSKTMANKTTNNLSINAHPDSYISQNTQKRYLPGDIRYQGPTQNNKINSLQQKPVNPLSPKKSVSIPSTEKIQQKIEKPKPSNNLNKKSNNNITPFVQKQQLNTNKSQLIEKKQQNQIKTPSLPFDKRKEISLNKNNEKIKKNIVENRQQIKRPLKPDGISLARIKQDSFNRNQMLQNMRKVNSATSSSNKSMRYANYSETDDDEEDDDEGGGYGDEYDSDLADFIDDSMVDDLQREDLEETLRLINPRYDKKKWMIRERMIDDRRMDARFKEVELEERRSAKYGLVEDLIEAKRGSKALA
ncbi:hypothetical protein ACQ4LE_001429 [Meloidogyne hapla]|uniref:Protein SPT2 homolog n=1 Tax=Meloidogyne hapla TaxID=6305 RepID=A0A1I8AZB6_MELHA